MKYRILGDLTIWRESGRGSAMVLKIAGNLKDWARYGSLYLIFPIRNRKTNGGWFGIKVLIQEKMNLQVEDDMGFCLMSASQSEARK